MSDQPPGIGVILALLAVMAVSVWLGALAHRTVERGSFLKGFFLGNRGLGVWALALTATVQSGGTFVGFPSFVYQHGWIYALWIAGYMVVPITGFAILGKRMAQLSRRTGAITVPDMLRERFASPAVGLVSSLLIIVFMTSMLIAQFKAGALVIKHAWPSDLVSLQVGNIAGVDSQYYLGLGVFAATVVGYTLIGGFMASVWTDLFQSVLMVFGVVILAALAIPAAGGLEHATMTAVERTGPLYAFGPGYSPSPVDGAAELGVTLPVAFSFFVLWVFTGVGSPASLVRLMASDSSETIRKSIIVLSLYNMLIYLPLIAIAVCAHSFLPLSVKSDEMIPSVAVLLTRDLPAGSFIGGLILAAPFGAIMATVSTYLVVISSGLVRDVYQRFFAPNATERSLRWATYLFTTAIGLLAVVANIRPVGYLQSIVVFSTSGSGAALLVPAVLAAYSRRASAAAIVTSMLAGSLTVLALFYETFANAFAAAISGSTREISVEPYRLLGVEPVIWGIVASAIAAGVVMLATRPPGDEHVERLFGPVRR
jgi:SSS family solute:Na+ symporter/sodium/pantothenate symporter